MPNTAHRTEAAPANPPAAANRTFPFKIGADPEFNIMLQSRRVAANKLLTILFKNKGYRSDGYGYEIGEAGNLGWDGASSTAEIRPAPSALPKDVVTNIGTLLKTFADNAKLFEASPLSRMAPVGGHIHLEIPSSHSNLTRGGNQGGAAGATLHKRVSSFYLPLITSEDTLNLKLRAQTSYGKITDYRIERKGDGYTYEFRCPSAEWMTTPKIAEATLAYMATIFNEALNHPQTFKKCSDVIFKTNEQGRALQSLANTQFRFFIETINKKVQKYIKEFEFYDRYKDEIQYILDSDQVKKDKEAVNFEIIRGWGFTDTKEPTKRDLLSDKKVQKRAMQINLDSMLGAVDLPYNQDTNVLDFIKAIKTRMICMNWKLKHNYFFFGLKRGIQDYIVATAEYMPNSRKLKAIHYGQDQIKTAHDWLCIEESLNRMLTRVPAMGHDTFFLVGIPYEDRIKMNTKKLVELVYDLDKADQSLNNLDSVNELPQTITKGDDSAYKGDIHAAYNEDNAIDNLVAEAMSSPANDVRAQVRAMDPDVYAATFAEDEYDEDEDDKQAAVEQLYGKLRQEIVQGAKLARAQR